MSSYDDEAPPARLRWSVLLNSALVFMVLALVFHLRPLLALTGVGPGSDVSAQHVFWRYFVGQSLGQGAVPFWNPHIFSGTPMMAALQGGVFYPTSLIYTLLPPTVGINLEFILHAFLAGWFMWILLRDMGLSRAGALMGGVIWGFNGVALSQFVGGHLPHANAYAWLPLVFMFARRLVFGRGRINMVWLALSFGLQILCGHPQNVIYTGMVVVFYLLWSAAGAVRSGRGVAGPAINMFRVGVGMALGAGLAMIQLMPSAEWFSNSVSSFPFMGEGYYFQGSLPPWSLPIVVAPNLLGNPLAGMYIGKGFFWENCFFLGAWALIFLGAALAGIRRLEGRWFFPVLAVVSLLFAFGDYTPVYPAALKLFPPLGVLRLPARYMFVFAFAASVMAAFGFEFLLQRIKARARGDESGFPSPAAVRLVVAGIAVLGVAAAVALAALALRGTFRPLLEAPLSNLAAASGLVDAATTAEDAWFKAMTYITLNLWDVFKTSAALALGGLLVLAVFRSGGRRRMLVAAGLPALVFLELAFFAATLQRMRPFEMPPPLAAEAARIIADKDPGSASEPFRVFAPMPGFGRTTGMPVRLPNIDGYDAKILGNYAEAIHRYKKAAGLPVLVHPNSGIAIKPFPGLTDLFGTLNVKYLILEHETQFHDEGWNPDDWTLLHAGGFFIYKADFPVSYLGFRPDQAGADPSVSYEVLRCEPARIAVEVQSSEPGVVVFSEVYYPAWKAFVNGSPAEIVEIDGLLRGVEAGAGSSVIELRYESDAFRAGMAGSAVSALLLLLIVVGPACFRALSRSV